MKDFIAPLATNFSLCGSIHVIKNDDNTPPALLDGAAFSLIRDAAAINNVGGPGAEDIVVADTCVTGELAGDADKGICDFTAVTQGEYWVVETTPPTGHALANPAYQHVTVTADTQASVTFVDPRLRGAILVHKTAKHAAAATGSINQSNVTFSIGGTTAVTNTNGNACVDGFLFGSYNVVETVPAGYHAAGLTTKSVTVDNAATCAATPYAGETVQFVNVPLTNITVSVDSQVVGGTASTIDCHPAVAGVDATTDVVTGDGSYTASDLEPTAPDATLVCTIVVDP